MQNAHCTTYKWAAEWNSIFQTVFSETFLKIEENVFIIIAEIIIIIIIQATPYPSEHFSPIWSHVRHSSVSPVPHSGHHP